MATQVIGKVKGDAGYSPVVSLSKADGVLTISVQNETSTVSESISTGENIQGDWNTTDTADGSYIWNKPTKVSQFTNDAGYVTTATQKEYSNATASLDGLMSKEDKAKLNGIAEGAQVNTVTGVKGNAESTYRTGEINITPGNIGALATTDIADWAKATNKPTYSASDVGALADTVTHLSGDVPTSRKINNKALTGDVTLDASDVGALADTTTHLSGDVPTSRKINDKALTSDITLTASDVGALPDTTTIPTVSDTYSATSTNAMSGKAVASALSGYDLSSKADVATTLSGYGITDAKITSGTITLGSNTITPLTADSTLDATKVTGTLPAGTYTDTTYVFNTAYNASSNKAATMSDITSAISGVTQFDYEIITGDLPATGTKGKIYLKANSGSGNNTYDEFIYVNNKYELLGTTQIDISGKADVATTLAGYGITDAKIASGTITLGTDTITPLTASSTLDATKVSGTLPTSTYTNTTYSDFVKSGSGAANGLVPQPPTTAGTTKYLREDGTWVAPPNDNTTYETMTAASSSAAGTGGLVPTPGAGAQVKFLRGDGTWQPVITSVAAYQTTAGMSDYLTTAGTAANSSKLGNKAASDYATTADIADFLTTAGTAANSSKLGNKAASDYATTASLTSYQTTADMSNYLTTAGTAADSTKLNGKAASDYLTTAGTASNASKLNNIAASNYLTTAGTAANASKLGNVAAASYQTTANCPTHVFCTEATWKATAGTASDGKIYFVN